MKKHDKHWVWFIWEEDHLVDQAFSKEEADYLLEMNPERSLIVGEPVYI